MRKSQILADWANEHGIQEITVALVPFWQKYDYYGGRIELVEQYMTSKQRKDWNAMGYSEKCECVDWLRKRKILAW